ncbi:MAG TPA: hypothetical protein PLJ33_04445 [Peptococcaceae bacterium]|jgi:hypothetical protein|nr:hypothetical protein [Clostridia bacterium]HOB82196.1 hypothetical protein [Peptococcaceae bacterium]HPZ71926.1 hypothetical protein [Peptococcaceae bacterium]HQD54097.1 hypothetical protein [Peptococcaceae bacterium]
MRKGSLLLLLGIVGIAASFTCFYGLFFSDAGGMASAADSRLGTYDLVFKYAQIYDGTGEREVFRGDIAIKDGRIVKVGYVDEQEYKARRALIFDVGGLTVMPSIVQLEKTNEVVEHLLKTSYPRYPAHYLYFFEGAYAGLSLAQVAQQRGESVEKTFAFLCERNPAHTKVYILPMEVDENKVKEKSYTVEELVAYYTGYLAEKIGKKDVGKVQAGCNADLSFFVTREYDEQKLREMLLRGEFPKMSFSCKKGKIIKHY